MTKLMAVRLNQNQWDKLHQVVTATGLNRSQVLQRLIDQAEVTHIRLLKANPVAEVSQAAATGFAPKS